MLHGEKLTQPSHHCRRNIRTNCNILVNHCINGCLNTKMSFAIPEIVIGKIKPLRWNQST